MDVVIATDGSDVSGVAARVGSRLVPPDATFHLVTVVPPRIDPMETTTGFAGATISDEEADQRFTAGVVDGDAILAETARGLGPRPFHQRVLAGELPADEICRFAAALGADLVVVGSSGHGLTELLLGSVSSRVVEQSTSPVLVVPGVD